jgi:hypothetical protein
MTFHHYHTTSVLARSKDIHHGGLHTHHGDHGIIGARIRSEFKDGLGMA